MTTKTEKIEAATRKALIVKLSNNYDWSAGNFSMAQLDAIVEATAGVSFDALARSVGQFMAGKVEGHNNARMPSGAELAINARMWDEAIAVVAGRNTGPKLTAYPIGTLPPPPLVPLGPLEVDFGEGKINMRDMAPGEKETLLANKGRSAIGGPENVVPIGRIKRMTDG